MARLFPAQLTYYGHNLECEQERNARKSLFFAALEAALLGRCREHSPVSRQHGMAEERVIRLRRGAPPEARRPAEEHGGLKMPILEQVDQGILVIQADQLRIDGIQLAA